MKTLEYISFYSIVVLFTLSCNKLKDEEIMVCDEFLFEEELSVEIKAVSDAAKIYEIDGNCFPYKKSIDDLLVKLHGFRNCAIENGIEEEYLDYVNKYEDEFESISC